MPSNKLRWMSLNQIKCRKLYKIQGDGEMISFNDLYSLGNSV